MLFKNCCTSKQHSRNFTCILIHFAVLSCQLLNRVSCQVTQNYSEDIAEFNWDCYTTVWGDIEDDCLIDDEEELQRNYKVLFGEQISPERHPYLASIQVPAAFGCYLHWCGATFITPQLLITAAHCIWSSDEDWRISSNATSGELNSQVYVAEAPLCRHQEGLGRYRVIKYWISEKYNPNSAGWDIAIIQIEKPAQLSTFISYEKSSEVNISKEELMVIGWGNSVPNQSRLDVVSMKGANLGVIDSNECEQIMQEHAGLRGPYDWDEEFCAYSLEADTCGGDSGGPILVAGQGEENDSLQDIQVGIISWGPLKACSDSKIQYPGVYTRIDTKVQWIQDVVRQHQLDERYSPPEIELGDLEEEVNCNITQAACKCNSVWQIGGQTLYGCANPDMDPRGDWCMIDTSTCIRPSAGLGWDYCQQSC
eukprot:TRINITY_DN7443_c0_g2_i1.p1 TRINITY_DN7443_c0_g2~~TRINITY_DN7443_c0_g2_i1.p1  ORF type:complete len:438 (-),score=20.33 TRINITY_DN7443_c0_g2_i1:274-1542(-)